MSVVQNATRPFMDPAAAIAAGYGPFLGCVSGTQEGAMGVHYVNTEVFDGKLEPDRATGSHQIRKSTRIA